MRFGFSCLPPGEGRGDGQGPSPEKPNRPICMLYSLSLWDRILESLLVETSVSLAGV